MTDWIGIITELRGQGMKVKAIARHAGCDPHKLYNILNGGTREPSHSEGVKILELHGRLCKETT